MASQDERSQSEDQFEELEDLIRQSEAAIESVTELIQELAGDDWEYLDVSPGQEPLTQYTTDPSECQEHRESGIFELTEPEDSQELKVKRELSKEEIEAEFHDLLNSLILELNDVKIDMGDADNIPPAWPPVPHQELEGETEDRITTRTTTEYFASDAATQTEIKKKSQKCTIL